jgi:glycosyltransferase involved in cell wall biosynthesis
VLFASDASEPAKRADVVLAALVPLAARHPAVRLRFVGPGDHRWALGSLGAAAADVERHVDVLGVGAAPDLPSRYRDATVTVLASAGEAFGLVLVESLASGTPVVCADAAGPREIVDDPAIGRRFRPDDPADLARALDECIELAADPATAARCATHAARWGWAERVGPAHEDLYRGMRRRPRRSG